MITDENIIKIIENVSTYDELVGVQLLMIELAEEGLIQVQPKYVDMKDDKIREVALRKRYQECQ